MWLYAFGCDWQLQIVGADGPMLKWDFKTSGEVGYRVCALRVSCQLGFRAARSKVNPANRTCLLQQLGICEDVRLLCEPWINLLQGTQRRCTSS